MTTITLPFPREWTVEDLIHHLGGIPASRIRLTPTPGTAVEDDVIRIQEEEGKLCELIDGVLVEKTMGYHESKVAGLIAYFFHAYRETNDLGVVTVPDGTMRLDAGQVRIPDVAFITHEREKECPTINRPIPDIVPDLAVEVLSQNNTPQEIERKRKEYFFAGTQLMWVVDPGTFTVEVWTSPEACTTFDETGELTGEPVLPGFRLAIARIFAHTPRPAAAKRTRRKKQS